MKKIINLLLISFIASCLTACWSEDIPETGAARHQVTDLVATPGDEEVQLAWTMPEGWNPTDFIVYYTNAESETITLHTDGMTSYTVDGLANGTQYTFYVQAVYGKLVSNYVTAVCKPATTRFPVTDLTVDAGDGYVTLAWSKPATTVLSYTLSYYNEDNPDDVRQESIDKDATTVTLDGLVNDKNYYFSLVANYAKGVSEPASVKAMPGLAIPYILDRDKAAKNQPITFSFNTADYPTATDVKWTFPGDVVKEGTVVKYGLGSVGTQTVKLNATIDGNLRTWTLEVEIREYVIYSFDWAQDGSNYNGFKGSCPVFSPDGKTVYNITYRKLTQLVAFDLITGTEKWRYTPSGKSGSYNMLTVNPITGDIYFGTESAGQFYAITSEGKLRWMFRDAQSMKSAAPAVNAAGTVVYICDKNGNTFAIDAASGQKIWSFAAGIAGGGLLVNGSELLIGAGTSAYFLNTETGDQIAKVALGCEMSDIIGFAVSNDKTLAYFGAKNGYIGAVDLTTHTAKTPLLTTMTNPNTVYEPVVAPNGSVFAGSKNGTVYNVKGDLSAVNWEYVHNGSPLANAFNYSHPCVDSENRFYITSGQTSNTTYIFDANGNVVDSWTYESGDNGQKQMGGNNYLDGVLYSAFDGSSTRNGIFVGKYVGGERASSWSTHGGDICGSCCVK
ncbi:fibronectin type III domain-containing protein [Alistipes finegoldii]|uniref:fibronectin type III domain-containing protein n=1 Tax=Alistipes finegoldii TaxID=214856 RepID=UPI002430E4DD|nr:fibronectin type III domain-containing protein [Alistipes finegoldii]